MARLLTIMGSGETAPTMTPVHRDLLQRVRSGSSGGTVSAVVLDTPYGFQENADDISGRAVDYFAHHLQQPLTVARWRSRAIPDVQEATALELVRTADYVFAGPGSPTYALDVWAGTPLADVLLQRLSTRCCLVFASAAAVVLGRAALPVYEIYKVGQPPHWRPGLDVLAGAGLRVAVIPHFDNAEGGTHDTRFCYLGERRLHALEQQLEPDALILGVDEHTACILDLDAGTATVAGRGGVTVRGLGHAVRVPAGDSVPLEQLAGRARRSRPPVATGPGAGAPGSRAAPGAAPAGAPAGAPGGAPGGAPAGAPGGAPGSSGPPGSSAAASALLRRAESRFADALASRDADGATSAILALERLVTGWAAAGAAGTLTVAGRTLLRGLIARLGLAARDGVRAPEQVLGPLVRLVVAERAAARAAHDYARADRLRAALREAGVELRDTPTGPEWALVSDAPAPPGSRATGAGAPAPR